MRKQARSEAEQSDRSYSHITQNKARACQEQSWSVNHIAWSQVHAIKTKGDRTMETRELATTTEDMEQEFYSNMNADNPAFDTIETLED